MQLINLAAFALSAGSSALAAPLTARAAAVDQLVGYGAGTTGGGSGAGITVTTCAQLTDAFKNTGGVIKIKGTIKDCGAVRLYKDNTSILGVGKDAGLTGGGIRMKDVNNVIIRNLKIQPAKKEDAIDIESSTKVWVDHCDLHSVGVVGGKDDYDGLFDAKHGSDFITVSWTKFHDHWKGSLIGHSDNSNEDTGKLHITYHHNSFINVNSRLPSVRFGQAHIYSNCYGATTTSGVNSRMGAKVLVEQNYFQDVNLAVVTDLDSKTDGFAVEKNNVFAGKSTTRITQSGQPSISYSYTTDPAASVCSIVEKSGGVGVVTF